MFNRLQMQEALKNPQAVPGQRLAQYQSPASPNPQVRPEDASAEQVRRAQMVQSAMGTQAAANDPMNAPTIMMQKEMENQQLKKMLAAMQQRQAAPMQVPQAPGIAGLPAPSAERGYAGGGIVAFKDGGDVERFSDGGLPAKYRKDQYSSFFGMMPGRNERLGGTTEFNRAAYEEDVKALEELKSKIASGAFSGAIPVGQLAALERDVAAGRAYLEGTQRQQAAPVVPDEAKAPTPGAITPQRREAPRNQPAPSRGPGLASIRGTPIPIGGDEPSGATQVTDEQRGEGILGLAQAQAQAQPQEPVGPELTRLARLRQQVADRQALQKEMGVEGNAGDALRTQIEEMRAAQAKQKEQAGLAGLASVLAAYGSAPRKRAAGAAAGAASQFITGQQAQEQKFNETMAAMKANALEKDRAEKRGDINAVIAAEQESEKLKNDLEKIRLSAELGAKEGALDRQLRERLENSKNALTERLAIMDRDSREAMNNADIRTRLRIAEMAPAEFRTLQLITAEARKKDPNATILDVISSRRGGAAGLDEDTLVREYNKAKQAHMEDRKTRDTPFPAYSVWKAQYAGAVDLSKWGNPTLKDK